MTILEYIQKKKLIEEDKTTANYYEHYKAMQGEALYLLEELYKTEKKLSNIAAK